MKFNLFVFSIALLVISFVSSCKKLDTTDIGSDLIPAVDNVNTFDTVMDVVTDNFLLSDSVRVLYNEGHAWGVIDNDPEFGKTKAEFFFAPTPSSFGVHPFAKKDSTPIFDSVVLALRYDRIYGDSNSVQKIEVYEIPVGAWLGQKLGGYRIDTVDMPQALDPIATATVDFKKLDDSVFDIRKRDTIRTKNQLRIRLDNALGARFLAYDTTNAYKTDSAFFTKFKGLALRVDEGGSAAKNALAYFLLNDNNTRLIFYYRTRNGATVTDTLATEFGFASWNRANANLIRRTPANNFLTILNNANTSDDKIYLQSSPGSYATVKIPNLANLSNRVVHRAELIFEALPSASDNIYTKPGYLFLDIQDTARKRIATEPYDFSYENNYTALFGGTIENNKYVFNLTRYVQSIVTRKEKDFTFRLSAPYTTSAHEYLTGGIPAAPIPVNTHVAAGRVVLTGGSYPDAAKKVRLRIIYSKI